MVRPTSLYCSWAPSLPTIAFLQQTYSKAGRLVLQLHLLYETAPRITDLSSVRWPQHLSSGSHSGRFTMRRLFSGALRCLPRLHFLLSTPFHPGLHLELVYPLCVASTPYSALGLCTRFMFYMLQNGVWGLSVSLQATSGFLFIGLDHHNPLTRGGFCVPRRAISPNFLQIPVWWIDYNLSW